MGFRMLWGRVPFGCSLCPKSGPNSPSPLAQKLKVSQSRGFGDLPMSSLGRLQVRLGPPLCSLLEAERREVTWEWGVFVTHLSLQPNSRVHS